MKRWLIPLDASRWSQHLYFGCMRIGNSPTSPSISLSSMCYLSDNHHRVAHSFALPNYVASTHLFVSNVLASLVTFWPHFVFEVLRAADGGGSANSWSAIKTGTKSI
jgi:hypothetical protein